jgi:hypothetical protein
VQSTRKCQIKRNRVSKQILWPRQGGGKGDVPSLALRSKEKTGIENERGLRARKSRIAPPSQLAEIWASRIQGRPCRRLINPTSTDSPPIPSPPLPSFDVEKMSTTLPLFWDLSSASKQKRLDSSAKLIETLQHFQNKFVEAKNGGPDNTNGAAAAATARDEEDSESGEEVDGSDDEDEEQAGELAKEGKKLDRALDAKHAEDVRYSIRRLVRGLASPRESSRLGFAVALTEVRPFKLSSSSSGAGVALKDIRSSIDGATKGDTMRLRVLGTTA